ncbi:MAG: hypothetical protein CBD52_004720 [Euryarchaeota archaeon TMED192]|nr:MAG: hypothetical protein CBD52_004720 [Euryarchaeota archaeon TMED192]|tara:strand:+ start:2530 stop:2823 length:294 start_codon:yes stop_codon:yes gene_type:complete
MPGKTRDYAAISLARILKERTDPHGYPMNDETIVQRLAISDEGGVKIWLKPKMPHCPCCLHDLLLLREEISNQRGVSSVKFEIVDIPGSAEWNTALS